MAGINKKKLNTAIKEGKKALNDLEKQLADYSKLVNEMNANIWYGGARSGRWYTAADKAYKADYKFCNNIRTMHKTLKGIQNTLEKGTGGSSSGSTGGSTGGSAGVSTGGSTPPTDVNWQTNFDLAW